MTKISDAVETLSPSQLNDVISKATRKRLALKKVPATRKAIDAILRKAKLSIRDVYPELSGKAAPRPNTGKPTAVLKTPTALKLITNPNNPEQTWTGRGRKPEWFKALSADDLAKIPAR